MRLNRILLFVAAVGCALILMATRAAKPAMACSALTLSASCSNGNPSVVSFSGSNYGNCGANGAVFIYSGCDQACDNCLSAGTYEGYVSTSSGGSMQGNYEVNCSSPNQGYVCAHDYDTNKWASSYIGNCSCLEIPQ
jgi:hypothetical protein